MPTSGQGRSCTVVDTFCTKDVLYWRMFEKPCNFTGEVDVYADTDGYADWTCPYCGQVNETTTDRLGLE